jgi:hypothetical protein
MAGLRELIATALLALAAAAAPAAAAQVAQVAPCTLVFGQGRNLPARDGPDWDALNARFNAGVTGTLEAAGRRVYPMTASGEQVDPEAAGLALLQQADRLGCGTLVETAVFDDGQDTLVLRLRVYPLLPQIGDGGTIVGLRIGTPLFVTQRDLKLGALQRLKPELLAQQMAAEYLQHDRR